ncbi:MAG: hypothetical protein KGL39_59890 [Patescibacteria group bacterium]|nr:hypothetical protein [Patescibacteria group bacterium]
MSYPEVGDAMSNRYFLIMLTVVCLCLGFFGGHQIAWEGFTKERSVIISCGHVFRFHQEGGFSFDGVEIKDDPAWMQAMSYMEKCWN